MLTIFIPDREYFNEQTNEFFTIDGGVLRLEHSLVSISKWESKWCKAFLSKQSMTREEELYYIKCMTLDENVNPNIYQNLTVENYNQIRDYINAPMTAFRRNDQVRGRHNETIISELIYYWMISLSIPVEFQHWHLNRLLALINVCNIKNTPPKKMSKSELASRYAAQNAANRRRFNSKG